MDAPLAQFSRAFIQQVPRPQIDLQVNIVWRHVYGPARNAFGIARINGSCFGYSETAVAIPRRHVCRRGSVASELALLWMFRIAAPVALAGVLAFAAVVAGLTAAIALAGVLTFTGVHILLLVGLGRDVTRVRGSGLSGLHGGGAEDKARHRGAEDEGFVRLAHMLTFLCVLGFSVF